MPTTINADTVTGGAVVTGDTSGTLELQSGGVTGLTVNGANVTTAGNLTVTGSITATGGGIPSLASPLAVIGNSTAGAEIRLPEDTDNGANYIALKAPNSLASNLTFTLPSTDGANGQVLQTNGSGTLAFASVTSGPVVEYSRQFVTQSSTTFTVPTGVTSVKLYACGKGGNGGTGGSGSASGGGGGGFGFGTLAVTAGQVIDITINGSGVATVARSGTTLITANPGSSPGTSPSGGAGGTASVHASLTGSGAYSGGAGGDTNAGYGGGGSAGSPLGNGFRGGGGSAGVGWSGGGGGIGGDGANGNSTSPAMAGGGGGAGGAAGGTMGGGAGGAARINLRPGPGRAVPFTDPFLALAVGPGGIGGQTGAGTIQQPASNGQPGGGGGGGYYGGAAGDGGFGGGGGGSSNGGSEAGGTGGILGGGGAGSSDGGTSLAGGGGGGRYTTGGPAVGGPATVWIFY